MFPFILAEKPNSTCSLSETTKFNDKAWCLTNDHNQGQAEEEHINNQRKKWEICDDVAGCVIPSKRKYLQKQYPAR